MTDSQFIPAAQYLRKSTEHQQYSLANQMAAIQKYAESKGFAIVQTYTDTRTGVILRRRAGLRQLLQDVTGGAATYRFILVYDVSRWGRFPDADESAHYEFLCKLAGIPVHYCAETFANDGTMPSLIMKALKRTMAAEYSRELGVKVFEGQKRLADLGFKQGGLPGYGLRRMLVDADRNPKQQLSFGERKSIARDRVILVPGPRDEVECVRAIYRMFLSEKRTVYAIARELNLRGIPYIGDSKWKYQNVYYILTHPKYAGCHIFGRTSSKLYTPPVRLERDKWTITPGAFEPIVAPATFAEAQRLLENRTHRLSDQNLLESLRVLLVQEGRLSHRLIRDSQLTPSPGAYRRRFGSISVAYGLIGYGNPSAFESTDLRHRTQALRADLIRQIQSMFPEEISVVRRSGRWRSRLRVRNVAIVSVIVARRVKVWKETIRWQIDPVPREGKLITLLARLNMDNDGLPGLPHFTRHGSQEAVLHPARGLPACSWGVSTQP